MSEATISPPTSDETGTLTALVDQQKITITVVARLAEKRNFKTLISGLQHFPIDRKTLAQDLCRSLETGSGLSRRYSKDPTLPTIVLHGDQAVKTKNFLIQKHLLASNDIRIRMTTTPQVPPAYQRQKQSQDPAGVPSLPEASQCWPRTPSTTSPSSRSLLKSFNAQMSTPVVGERSEFTVSHRFPLQALNLVTLLTT